MKGSAPGEGEYIWSCFKMELNLKTHQGFKHFLETKTYLQTMAEYPFLESLKTEDYGQVLLYHVTKM